MTLRLHHVEVEAEILDSNLDEAQLQRLRNGERPGALWHLFRADDAKKIRDYLDRVGLPVECHSFISLLILLDSTQKCRL